MVYPYKGHYLFNKATLDSWSSTSVGVYYLGAVDAQEILRVSYVGRGCGVGGMCGRLRDHLDEWPDVSHFGYRAADSIKEAEDFERAEIARLNPTHNTIGVA